MKIWPFVVFLAALNDICSQARGGSGQGCQTRFSKQLDEEKSARRRRVLFRVIRAFNPAVQRRRRAMRKKRRGRVARHRSVREQFRVGCFSQKSAWEAKAAAASLDDSPAKGSPDEVTRLEEDAVSLGKKQKQAERKRIPRHAMSETMRRSRLEILAVPNCTGHGLSTRPRLASGAVPRWEPLHCTPLTISLVSSIFRNFEGGG